MALTDGLVAYWSFDEASGNAADATGNGHTMVETSGTIARVSAKISNGADFEAGDTEYFTCADSSFADFPTTAMTIAFWAQPESLSAKGTFLEKSIHGGSNSFGLISDTSGRLIAYTNPSTSGYANHGDTPTSALVAGEMHHYAVVFDGAASGNSNRLKIYKDGSGLTLSFTGTIPASIDDSTAPVNIGTWGSLAYYYDGILDEMGLWNIALTSGDVTSLYNSGSGLAYPFSGGGATVYPSLLLTGVGR